MDAKITPTKEQIIELLDAWIRRRPGLEFANYGSISGYRSELRSITKDLRDARKLLRSVEYSAITAPELLDAFGAYSGRLRVVATDKPDEYRLEYCAGQYWPTEYRAAVCAVLASALWNYHRTDNSTGDSMRAKFRRMFGRGLSARWFN
jgi:hypothetical protein